MDKKKKILRISCVIMGVVFLAVGIILEQPQMIYMKAIRICLECIGIG